VYYIIHTLFSAAVSCAKVMEPYGRRQFSVPEGKVQEFRREPAMNSLAVT